MRIILLPFALVAVGVGALLLAAAALTWALSDLAIFVARSAWERVMAAFGARR